MPQRSCRDAFSDDREGPRPTAATVAQHVHEDRLAKTGMRACRLASRTAPAASNPRAATASKSCSASSRAVSPDVQTSGTETLTCEGLRRQVSDVVIGERGRERLLVGVAHAPSTAAGLRRSCRAGGWFISSPRPATRRKAVARTLTRRARSRVEFGLASYRSTARASHAAFA